MSRFSLRPAAALDAPRVEQAIRSAELHTTGEIRVSVCPYFRGEVLAVAEQAFARLGMAQTRQRNGVLFFVVPSRRRLAVLGDVGIHWCVAPGFWARAASVVEEGARVGDLTGGLVRAIALTGEELARHFPAEPGTKHQLPDEVIDLRSAPTLPGPALPSR